MEPRDAYRRPEVFAFMDARMLGAFVSTSRSAKTAARECDAWSAIARRQHERPTYFGGKPGSNEHMTFLHRTFHAPEFYALEPGQSDAAGHGGRHARKLSPHGVHHLPARQVQLVIFIHLR